MLKELVSQEIGLLSHALKEFERVEYEQSLYAFMRRAWTTFDPSEFIDGWCLEAICEHLEAVINGEIRRLIINVPPRTAKSGATSVCLQPWVWAQRNKDGLRGPGIKFLTGAYGSKLAIRDLVKSRRVINSAWYQGLWGDRYQLSNDQNAKTNMENTSGGARLITSVDTGTTGEGGDIIVIDDGNDARKATSELVIEAAQEWWDNSLRTRLNNANSGAFINIQQRLAENDLTGHILSKSRGDWVHLMLPMRYEPNRSFTTAIGWKDPRTTEGELLFPERFDEEAVLELEADLGKTQAAGQLQQNPKVKGGNIIKEEWWKPWDEDFFPPFTHIVASLDSAFTEDDENDPSALTIWGVFSGDVVAHTQIIKPGDRLERTYPRSGPRVMLIHAFEERYELNPLVNAVAAACKKWRVDNLIIEDKASGKSVSQEIKRLYARASWTTQLVNPRELSKTARLYSVQHLFEEGLIYAPDKTYSDKVISQCATFPKASHDDLVDTVSQALMWLRKTGRLTRPEEDTETTTDRLMHQGKPPQPLYDGAS